jgi:transposase
MIMAWKQERVARSATGDPGSCDLREVVNAIFYQNRTGCQWRYLPHDLPAWSAVFYYFALWRQDGLDQRIQELLRCQVRERAGRLEDPSLVVIDTQSVRAAAGVGNSTANNSVIDTQHARRAEHRRRSDHPHRNHVTRSDHAKRVRAKISRNFPPRTGDTR